jgi:hypothetical protein
MFSYSNLASAQVSKPRHASRVSAVVFTGILTTTALLVFSSLLPNLLENTTADDLRETGLQRKLGFSDYVGILATIMNIVMYAAPLAIVKTVIIEKNSGALCPTNFEYPP